MIRLGVANRRKEILRCCQRRKRTLDPSRPGHAGGKMLRRYWWPVGFSEEVKAKGGAGQSEVVGGRVCAVPRWHGTSSGLVALHCSHRGTSLEFGRVEDNGIRCCYHGWLYDMHGNCLEQPAEPDDSTFKDRIQHPAYHAQDAAGLIFAYVGPEPAPLLPSYDLLVEKTAAAWSAAAKNFAIGCSAPRTPPTARTPSRCMPPAIRTWR